MKVEIDTSKVRLVAKAIRTKQEEIVKELNSTTKKIIETMFINCLDVTKFFEAIMGVL